MTSDKESRVVDTCNATATLDLRYPGPKHSLTYSSLDQLCALRRRNVAIAQHRRDSFVIKRFRHETRTGQNCFNLPTQKHY